MTGDISVTTPCTGCGAPWGTEIVYQPKWDQWTIRQTHRGFGAVQIESARMMRDTREAALALAIEKSTLKVADECGCFDQATPPRPTWVGRGGSVGWAAP